MARFSKLLGPDGGPIDLDALFGPPKAAPTLTGVRSPISGHPADGLTPSRLAAIHRQAADGDPLAYLELAEDIEERDPHYTAVLGARKRQVSQLAITVEPASDGADDIRNADLIREWLKSDVLQAALFDLFDAIGKGLSILEIEWESTPGLVAPKALTWRDPRWFGLDDVSLDEPLLYEGIGKEPLAPHRFVVHRHKAKSGLAIRSGVARIASWAWMYKAFTLRDWAVFTQNYGMPVRVGKWDAGATEEQKETLWRAVSQIAGDCAAIIPDAMKIEFVELKNTADGSALYEKRADWMDRQISKLVLGQTATTDAIAGGHAVGKEHRLVQEDLERYDAALASATITRQLVRPMVAFNFGPQNAYPKLILGRPDELPIEKIVDALYKLGPQGLEIEESQLLERLGVTEKAEGARVVGGRQAAAAPGAPGRDPSSTPDPGQPPAEPQSGRLLAGLASLHASAPDPEYVEALTRNLADDMDGVLGGLVDQVRVQFMAAGDMHDLARRLERLQLSPAQFADAMTRGMALAHMVGRAALIDELRRG